MEIKEADNQQTANGNKEGEWHLGGWWDNKFPEGTAVSW